MRLAAHNLHYRYRFYKCYSLQIFLQVYIFTKYDGGGKKGGGNGRWEKLKNTGAGKTIDRERLYMMSKIIQKMLFQDFIKDFLT